MATVADLEMENKQLKKHIEELAQFGKDTLESNTELNRQLEEVQELCSMQVEKFHQENYSLKMKIESNVYERQNLISEMENMKEKLQEDAKNELSRIATNHDKKIDELQVEIDSLQNELEKGTLVADQLQDKISKQEQMLDEAHTYSKKLEGMDILESQLEELKEQCSLMKFDNDEMKIALTDVNDEKEQMLFDQKNLVQKIDYLKENLEEKTIQGKTWFDTMQDSRQEISQLQMEISLLNAKLHNKSHKEKGNSLFGEVEDKRLALEQKYSAVSTKYESLQKIYQIVKKQLVQLKTRILPMLQMASNQADFSQIKRLEAALSQSRNETQILHVKMKDLRKANDERALSEKFEEFHDAFTDFKENECYVTFLKNEISCLQKTLQDLRSENDITTFKHIAETDKRRETESLLHTSEVKKEKLEHEVLRLRLKLDELKMKLQQDVKSAEQIQELPNARESKRSIWNDDSLLTKTKKPQAEKDLQNRDVKSTGKIQELSSARESKPSIWNDDSILKKTKKPQAEEKPKENVSEKLPKNQTKNTEVMNSSTLKAQFNKPATIQAAPNVKFVERVMPLNESRRSGEEREHNESTTTHLTEPNNTSVSVDHSTADSILEAEKKMEPSILDDQNGNASISRENGKARVRRQEPHKRRIVRVKKDAGLNECQQQ